VWPLWNGEIRMKYSIGIVIFLGVSVALFCVFYGGGKKSLLVDMEATKKNSSTSFSSIDSVVSKYIPVGTSKNEIIRICKENEFDVKFNTNLSGEYKEKYDEIIICSHVKYRWYLIFKDRYEGLLYMKDGKALSVFGVYFLDGI